MTTAPPPHTYGRSLLTHLLRTTDPTRSPVTHLRELPGRNPQYAPWPQWVLPAAHRWLTDQGIDELYTHQTATANLAWEGTHVVVATGTASGKTLGYQLPVLTMLAEDPTASALYLSPPKPSAPTNSAPSPNYSTELPTWPRTPPNAVSSKPPTHPNMTAILPPKTAAGSATTAASSSPTPTCCTSPSSVNTAVGYASSAPSNTSSSMNATPTGEPSAATSLSKCAVSSGSLATTAPHPPSSLPPPPLHTPQRPPADSSACPSPPLPRTAHPKGSAPSPYGNHPSSPDWREKTERKSGGPPPKEAANIMADLVAEGARTLAFVRSRRGAENTALATQHALISQGERGELPHDRATALAEQIGAYRAGYLAEDRRRLERELNDGTLLGAATTTALELGVDIAGLDAVVIAGFPGTVASFWQQSGRAGRRNQGSLVVLIARSDPLDHYIDPPSGDAVG